MNDLENLPSKGAGESKNTKQSQDNKVAEQKSATPQGWFGVPQSSIRINAAGKVPTIIGPAPSTPAPVSGPAPVAPPPTVYVPGHHGGDG